MDDFTQPPADRPDETRAWPEGAPPYQPGGPVDPSAPYGYPPPYGPGPSAAPGQPGYPPANPSAPYGQPGYPSQYGQPGYPSQYGQYGQFGAPAPMSGQYPGYGQQPPSQYPGPAYPSMPMAPGGYGAPPPRRRRPVWQWIVGSVGALLILCCVLGVIGVALARNNPSAFVASVHGTATVAATSTPVPSPTITNKSPGVGFHMFLGHNYRKTTAGDFAIVSPANAFKASDEFAFVIRLGGPIGTTKATLRLVSVESGGVESVKETAPMSISNPNYSEFANKLSAAQLMVGLDPGVYRLEVKTSSATVASAEFIYEG